MSSTAPPPGSGSLPRTRSSARTRSLFRPLVLVLLVGLALLSGSTAWAQDPEEFPGLVAGQRVYDETGTSLTPEQSGRVFARLTELGRTGADAVVVVRALDADSDDTYDQVEALQQAWVRVAGVNQDTAVAILINRNPEDDTDARAGIFVGRTYQDGNVPEREQEAIVEDALIPPLRSGDVFGALTAAVDRLEGSIRNGPPVTAFDRWSAGLANGWLPIAEVVLAVLALGAAVALFARRSRPGRPDQEPTTRRPGELSPAVVERLVTGSSSAQATSAVLLDLAARGALAIEPESEGGTWGKPTVRVRLLDRGLVRGEIEEAVWARLTELADGDVVDGKSLTKLGSSNAAVSGAVRRRLDERGWLDPGASAVRTGLAVLGGLLVLCSVFGFVVAAGAGGPALAFVGAVALLVVGMAAVVLAAAYPTLSAAGQDAAVPWRAYRDGLKGAAKTEDAPVDLDRALPDVVALGLASAMGDRLEKAAGQGPGLRAFRTSTAADGVDLATFPWWVAFSSTTATSGGSAGTVSGAGAGGGGGAAGST